MNINTANSQLVGVQTGGGHEDLVTCMNPKKIMSKEEAYRQAAYLKIMADTCEGSPDCPTFDQIVKAVEDL